MERTCRTAVVTLIALTVVLLSACATGTATPADEASSVRATSPTAAEGAYPYTFDNCGLDVTIESRPERIVLFEPSAVRLLDAVGALDTVIARIGDHPDELFGDEIDARLASIPELDVEHGSTGGAQVSIEAIVDLEPDLVIGYESETITRSGLSALGIDLYVIPSYCDEPPEVSFEDVYAEAEHYGRLFDEVGAGRALADELRSAVEAASTSPVVETGTTGAALYVASDGSAIYAYSRRAMVHPQFEVLGVTNVFADLPERVTEISVEELIERDPDELVLLYSDATTPPETIAALVSRLPGADALGAVRSGRVHPLLFNYSEPPSPLVVDGLGVLAGVLRR